MLCPTPSLQRCLSQYTIPGEKKKRGKIIPWRIDDSYLEPSTTSPGGSGLLRGGMCCYNLCPICECKCTCSSHSLLPFGFQRNIKLSLLAGLCLQETWENSKDFHVAVVFRRIGTDPGMSGGLSVRNSEPWCWWWCQERIHIQQQKARAEKAFWKEEKPGTAITNKEENRKTGLFWEPYYKP